MVSDMTTEAAMTKLAVLLGLYERQLKDPSKVPTPLEKWERVQKKMVKSHRGEQTAHHGEHTAVPKL